MAEKEIWKDIGGYEGMYQVSNLGRVRSLDRINFNGYNLKGRLLSQRDDTQGYLKVAFYNRGIRKDFKVHRLVAEYFIPNPENKPQINHKNSIRSDNMYTNLEWCTTRENIMHSVYKNRWGRLHVQYSPIIKVCPLTGNVLGRYYSAKEAENNDPRLQAASILLCCQGKNKSHKGFIFVCNESDIPNAIKDYRLALKYNKYNEAKKKANKKEKV